MKNMQIDLYCDGACSGNPGPGGYAFTLIAWNPATEAALKTHHDSAYELHTTNQRMELRAAIAGLSALTQPTTLRVISDSQYLIKGMTEWIGNWQQNNWRNARKKPIDNQDLWLELLKAAQAHTITWVWTKGHASVTNHFSDFNNLVDEAAVRQRDIARRLAIGKLSMAAVAYELTNFVPGKLVALNGAIVTSLRKRDDGKYRVRFETHEIDVPGAYKLYELP